MLDWAVGIDLGGTNIRVAKVDVLGKVSQPIFVEIDKSYADSPNFAQIISIVDEIISTNQEHPPLGIGFGVTGPINVKTGIIDNPFTLPAFFQGNIKKTLEDRFNLKVAVENDANAACIGEAIFGAGEGADIVACLILGTGVGVGVINNGVVYRGANGAHPEAGHVHVDATGPLCYCGRNGCLEALVSGTALKNIGVERGVLSAGQNAKDLVRLAETGNKDAVQIMQEAQQALGLGVVNLIYTYGPEKIIITGGALSRTDTLLIKLQAIADEACTYTKLRSEIKFGSLGDWAGTIGAATRIIRSW
ncbi:MAG: ROK family protein [Actinobacteria bacterium]|uniref:Unannotated protein n=1 Tax=freshwater metagenome TaxID=449393 RepID=A0A6J7SE13_9ZZZZ|nr:ROK family protein [Actinomycetota bacterium]MSX26003.1 ROK family protein [Actinomycetota bacterium]MSY05666.1 ROK family protein [Actinomycetota bacterium]MSY67931.1 ROK family protein [Actinomycetota bacterium]MSZ59554.1 ROK family protein [Actinomycetota bacterium]